MRCRDAPLNTYSLYLAPQFFNKSYYLRPVSANIYVSVRDISINDIAFVNWRIPRVDLSRFSRQFGKTVPRGRARAASRPFAPAIIVTPLRYEGDEFSRGRDTREYIHPRSRTAMRTSGPFRAARFPPWSTIHSLAGVPLMRVPPCGNWPLLL